MSNSLQNTKPTPYQSSYPDQARKLRLLGATYAQLADFFNVKEPKIRLWMQKYPAFRAAVIEGADLADAKVAESLFKRACGYTHPEDKVFVYQGEQVVVPTIKHYPPDTAAAQFWLRVRQRERWGDNPKDEDGDFGEFTVVLQQKNKKGKLTEKPVDLLEGDPLQDDETYAMSDQGQDQEQDPDGYLEEEGTG